MVIGAVRTHQVRIGGVPKEDLLAALQAAGVRLNEAARALFADARFTTAPDHSVAECAVVSVADLELPDGVTFATIVERAESHGLMLCPLELGPHLRLQYTDQPEGFLGQPASRHEAPPGSVTVASAPWAGDDQAPKGFYLRRIEGDLWLRGYLSWPGHHWNARDVFVFVRARDPVDVPASTPGGAPP